MKEYLILFVFAIAGTALHILWKARDAITEGKKIEWRRHLLFGGIGIITCAVVIALREEIKEILPLTKVMIFFFAYFVDSSWKNLTKFYGKKVGGSG